MTRCALTWNVQERAGYLSDYAITADKKRLLLPAELTVANF